MLRVIVGGIVVLASAFLAVYLSGPRQIEAPQRQRNAARRGSASRRSRRNEVLCQIRDRILACMICLDTIPINDSVWFCPDCSTAGHMRCLTTFVNGGGDYCPTCRKNIRNSLPLRFTCMCGRVANPRPNSLRPFSCQSCVRCGQECHPGPC